MLATAYVAHPEGFPVGPPTASPTEVRITPKPRVIEETLTP